ncbi:hypothetical protein ABPG74_020435 [Tetrahymena malaccensis]
MDQENQNSLQNQLITNSQSISDSSNAYPRENFRESLTIEYLRQNKKERQIHYGIQLLYFICFLFFGVVFVMHISGSSETTLGYSSPKIIPIYVNQLTFYLVQFIQQAIRFRLIRHNYDFFNSQKPKILMVTFCTIFFIDNLFILFFLISNLAYSQLQERYKSFTEYVAIPNEIIACIIILFAELILGFYNNLLLVYTLKRRMKNTIVNRILAQSQIRPNEYMALQQYLQMINSQSRFSQSSQSQNNSTLNETFNQNQNNNNNNLRNSIRSEVASDLIKQKDFVVYGDDSESVEKQEFTCSICQIQIQLQEKVIHLQCKHLYHSDCLQVWLVNHHTCPLCRQVVW